MTKPRLDRWPTRLLCLAAAILAAASLAAAQNPPPQQQLAPLDLPSYAATLRRCSRQLSAAGENPAAMHRFRESLPAEWTVRAGNETFHVSTAWLASALTAAENKPAAAAQRLREASSRLEFLRQQALEMRQPPAVSAAAARAKLDNIFRRREFRGLAGPTPLELWWRRVNLWLAEHFARLLARLHLGGITGNVISYGVIALAVILLALWAWRGLAGLSRQAVLRLEPGSPPRDSRSWIREALAAADRGEYREAIHCAYWAAVARLEALGVFPADRSRTPRELLRLLDSRPEEKATFRELASRFELVWYGYRPPSAADWDSTKAQLEKMGCLGFSTAGTANS